MTYNTVFGVFDFVLSIFGLQQGSSRTHRQRRLLGKNCIKIFIMCFSFFLIAHFFENLREIKVLTFINTKYFRHASKLRTMITVEENFGNL